MSNTQTIDKKAAADLRTVVHGYLRLDKTAHQLSDIQKKVAAVVDYDAAYAYDCGFLKQAAACGLDEKEGIAAYDIARRRLKDA